MSKRKELFFCRDCGFSAPKWVGRCPGCGEWGSLEMKDEDGAASGKSSEPATFEAVTEIRDGDEGEKLSIGIDSFDRILGQGVERGASLLLGGAPGVGKSTLSVKWSGELARCGEKVLYVCGEEAKARVAARCRRLGVESENFFLTEDTGLESLIQAVGRTKPSLLVLDSLQATAGMHGEKPAFGGNSVLSDYLWLLLEHCRKAGVSSLVVGHVTKEGVLAGPRLLEHMVDVVLHFEPQGNDGIRILRSVKNRFGPTDEIGVFRMSEKGLEPVEDTVSLFLCADRARVSGSCLCPVFDGGKVFVVEVQALVAPAAFAAPARKVSGYDAVRVSMILAVLDRRIGMNLSNEDVFVNVVGGLKVKDPGTDFAVAAALYSSVRNKVIPENHALYGEVGLAGEVRRVAQGTRRMRACERLGLKAAGAAEKKGIVCPDLTSYFKEL